MKTLVFACLLAAAGAAAAQTTVWRCGDRYADAPCPGGRELLLADARSAAERSAAQEVVARDRALAERLRSERLALAREQAPAGNGLGGIRSGAVQAVAVKPKKPAPPKRPKAPTKPKRP